MNGLHRGRRETIDQQGWNAKAFPIVRGERLWKMSSIGTVSYVDVCIFVVSI